MDQNHAYYYQVQTQLFVMFSMQIFVCAHLWQMMTERVTVKTVMCTLNEYTRTMAFGQNALLMHSIFRTCLLPEIMGKWLTRYSRFTSNSGHDEQSGSSENTKNQAIEDLSENSNNCDQPRYCYCRGPEADTMIGCDNPDCPIEWFHIECLQIRTITKGKFKWYCPDCRKLTKFLRNSTKKV